MTVVLIREKQGSRILVRGASGVLTPVGALSAKFAQNMGGGGLLKIAWKLHDFEKTLRCKGGPGPQGPPESGSGEGIVSQ